MITLNADEIVVYRAKIHWLNHLFAAIVAVAGIVSLLLPIPKWTASSPWLLTPCNPQFDGIVLLVFAAWYLFRLRKTKYVITNQRVIADIDFWPRQHREMAFKDIQTATYPFLYFSYDSQPHWMADWFFNYFVSSFRTDCGDLIFKSKSGATLTFKRIFKPYEYSKKEDEIITPLIIAVQEDNATAVEFLLRLGEPVDEYDHYECNPLTFAMDTPNIEIVRILLNHGADVNRRVLDGRMTPLMWAAERNLAEIGELLIQRGADVHAADPNNGDTALLLAIHHDGLEFVKMLLRHGVSLFDERDNGGQCLLLYRSHEMIKLLIEHGVDVDECTENGFSALMASATAAYFDETKLLLDKGADVNLRADDDMTPLLYANDSWENYEVLKLLHEHGAELDVHDCNGKTPLMYAVQGNPNEPMVKYLLEHGARINDRDNNGRTALHYAAEAAYLVKASMLNILLEHGAEVNARDNNGTTPLMELAKGGADPKSAKLLLRYGASVYAHDKEGCTALHLATTTFSQPISYFKILLANGAYVNEPDINGVTPLMYAAGLYDNIKLLKMLLRHGAKADMQDNEGKTALDHAIENDNKKNVAFLKQYIAK